MFGFLAKFHCLPYNISATTPESLSLSLVPKKKYTKHSQLGLFCEPKTMDFKTKKTQTSHLEATNPIIPIPTSALASLPLKKT